MTTNRHANRTHAWRNLRALEVAKAATRKPRPTTVTDKAEVLARLLELTGVTGWEREHKFHPTRKWRLDIAFPEQRLGIEVEGGIWTQGRHSRGVGFKADCEKYAELAIAGWRLIRVVPEQIKSGEALEWIKRALVIGSARLTSEAEHGRP